MTWSMNRFAAGMSAAANSQPEFITFAKNSTFRDSLSNLATHNVALLRLAWAKARASCGRSARFPDSTSVYHAPTLAPIWRA